MLAVQECYISVCQEKDMLEKEEALIRVNEVYKTRSLNMFTISEAVGHGSYAHQTIGMEK